MPETAVTIQAKILQRTGDIDPTTGDPVVGGGGYLSSLIAGVWSEYSDKAYVAPRLQELYTERDLYDRMIALIQDKYDFTDEQSSFKRSQRVQTLVSRREVVQQKVEALLLMVNANRAPAVGQLTTVAPVSPPFPQEIDAGSPRYGGSPYYPRPGGYP
jgi:hypothetical protein